MKRKKLASLTAQTQLAADRSSASIDDALASIDASEARFEQEVRFAVYTELSQIVRLYFPDTIVSFGYPECLDDGNWSVELYMPETLVRERYVVGRLFSDPDYADINCPFEGDPLPDAGLLIRKSESSEEIWAVTPVGREFGSTDYERYEALDASMRRFLAGTSKQVLLQASKLARKYRRDALQVQAALRELGHDVSLTVAAYVWMTYSDHMRATWMSGAQSTDSARDTLWRFFGDIDGLAVGVIL